MASWVPQNGFVGISGCFQLSSVGLAGPGKWPAGVISTSARRAHRQEGTGPGRDRCDSGDWRTRAPGCPRPKKNWA